MAQFLLRSRCCSRMRSMFWVSSLFCILLQMQQLIPMMTMMEMMIQMIVSVREDYIYQCILRTLNCSSTFLPETIFSSQSSPPFFSSLTKEAIPLPKVEAPRLLYLVAPILRRLGYAVNTRRERKMSSISFIVSQQLQSERNMRFKEDSIEEFINYKLNNPQALEEEMRMIRDRQDCTKKLNDYAKHMEQLKNQYNMYKELLDASVAKKLYLQQTYEQNASDLNEKIANCKEEIEYNTREIKERESRNEYNRKRYNDFQKDIALRKDKLTEYHLNELTSLFNRSQALRKSIEEKREKRAKLEEELMLLRDRERIIENTEENVGIMKNKWMMKKNELEKMREEESRKDKEIRDQVNNAMSMEKVIYGNFYKRCAQIASQMRAALEKLFDRDFNNIEGSNLQEKLEKMVQQLKANKQAILNFISEKREKYKIGQSLPEPDAQVYNNIVQTKINPALLVTINKADYRNNDYLLKEIEDGLVSMFEKMQIEKQQSLARQAAKANEIEELKDKIREFESKIQSKKKQISSPTKRGKK